MKKHAPALAALTFVAACASAPAIARAANCQATIPTGLAFGNYDPFAGVPVDTVAHVQIRCSAKATAQIQLGNGLSGNSADRQMQSGTSRLHYNVYNDAQRSDVWTSTEIVVLADRTQTVPVYGRIGANQRAAAGAYTDTLTITIWY